MLSVRSIPNIPVERARLRSTLVYRITPRLQAGLEWNPLAEDVGPIANWRVWDEDAARPALILGTSSDRIGTDHGRKGRKFHLRLPAVRLIRTLTVRTLSCGIISVSR